MAEMLVFYRGGLTVADYDAMPLDRRDRLFQMMRSAKEQNGEE